MSHPVAGALVLTVGMTLLTPAAGQSPRPVRRDLLVAAAASLSEVAHKLAQPLHDATGLDVRFNFGSSNTLARQIVEGARVDVFFSADEAQMDVVENADRLVAGTRLDVLSNQLVVIVPSVGKSSVSTPDDLAKPAVRRVAMGDPAAVPVGVYGRCWLETIRLWSAIEPKVVPLPTTLAVAAAVREGRAQAGIVYATDVRTPAGAYLRVAHAVSLDDAPAITYPAAVIRGGRVPDARKLLDFLRSAAARRIFEDAGFRVIANTKDTKGTKDTKKSSVRDLRNLRDLRVAGSGHEKGVP